MASAPQLSLDPRFLRKLESLALVSRRLASGSQRGERTSRQSGAGIAFASHRAYAPGDDFRFVDWKAFARSDRLYVKQFEEERDLLLHLVLDCSSSMAYGDGAKFDYEKRLAAALGYIALANLERVSVQPFASEPLPRLAPLRGKNRALVLLRYLAELRAEGGTALAKAVKAVLAEPQRGLSFVLSDGFDGAGLLAGVDLLRFAGLEPLVLLISDPRERALDLSGEVTLVDSETGEASTLRADARLLTRYRAAYDQRLHTLRSALAQRRVPLVELSIEVPLERAVLDLLRRGGVVR